MCVRFNVIRQTSDMELQRLNTNRLWSLKLTDLSFITLSMRIGSTSKSDFLKDDKKIREISNNIGVNHINLSDRLT